MPFCAANVRFWSKVDIGVNAGLTIIKAPSSRWSLDFIAFWFANTGMEMIFQSRTWRILWASIAACLISMALSFLYKPNFDHLIAEVNRGEYFGLNVTLFAFAAPYWAAFALALVLDVTKKIKNDDDERLKWMVGGMALFDFAGHILSIDSFVAGRPGRLGVFRSHCIRPIDIARHGNDWWLRWPSFICMATRWLKDCAVNICK